MRRSTISVVVDPDEYSSWNESGCPALTPAPHSVAPVPGRWQVEVPFGVTFQPCAVSRLTALAGSYG